MTMNKEDRTVVSLEEGRDDFVEKLLQLADSGPDIPAGGADQIKAALRPAWQRQVNRTDRRVWLLGMAAALILAFVFSYDSLKGPVHSGPVALVEGVVGVVEIEGPEGIFETIGIERVGESLEAGSWLETGEGAHAALRLADGHCLRLDGETRVRLDTPLEIRLDQGALYLDSDDSTAGPVAVRSAFGVVRDVGTRFEVRAEKTGLKISVRDGRVEIERDDLKIEVPVGQSLTVRSDGSTEIHPIAADAPEWAWVMEAGPAFEIEGRTVLEVLRWAGEETGLRVQYEDAATAALAASTVLHGQSGGLEPADAAAVVLPAAGLTSSVSNETLTVSQLR